MKFVVFITLSLLFFGCNTKKQACSVNATIVYDGFSTCQYFLEINSKIYEVSNLDNFATNYFDGLKVRVDFQELISIQPVCFSEGVIELYCYEQIE